MNLEDYKKFHQEILLGSLSLELATQKYVKLMEVFVQDCAISWHEQYFANTVKAKAKLLLDLQRYINGIEIT